jgi:hypothetical protein
MIGLIVTVLANKIAVIASKHSERNNVLKMAASHLKKNFSVIPRNDVFKLLMGNK